MRDPKSFLIEEYRRRQLNNPNFSQRSFARWLGLSPAQLSQMMAGKRNITLKTLKKINDRLGVSPANSHELLNSVLRQKNLIVQSPSKKASLLREDKFALVADWYHLAILSLTKVKGAKSDPRWVASRLGIKVEEAHLAIQRLERMGILQCKPIFKQIGEPFEVVSAVPSPAIRKYHKHNLSLAIEKIETVDVSLRQFQSISIPTDTSVINAMKEEIDIFLARATEICNVTFPTEVYHLNIQFFPVTKTITTKDMK
jgi:uncharacterized protein (TIGR02147 family)